MPIIPQNLNINNLRTTSAKSINPHLIRKLIEYSLKKVGVNSRFTPTVFKILLSEGRSVLSPAHRGAGSERVKVAVQNQKNIRNLLKLLEKWLTYKLRRFWMILKLFWFCLTLSIPEKWKNSIFEMPIIPQPVNINNLRTTSPKSISLLIIRKLIEYSWKNVCVKAMFTPTAFDILSPAQWGRRSERVKSKKKKLALPLFYHVSQEIWLGNSKKLICIDQSRFYIFSHPWEFKIFNILAFLTIKHLLAESRI